MAPKLLKAVSDLPEVPGWFLFWVVVGPGSYLILMIPILISQLAKVISCYRSVFSRHGLIPTVTNDFLSGSTEVSEKSFSTHFQKKSSLKGIILNLALEGLFHCRPDSEH